MSQVNRWEEFSFFILQLIIIYRNMENNKITNYNEHPSLLANKEDIIRAKDWIKKYEWYRKLLRSINPNRQIYQPRTHICISDKNRYINTICINAETWYRTFIWGICSAGNHCRWINRGFTGLSMIRRGQAGIITSLQIISIDGILYQYTMMISMQKQEKKSSLNLPNYI